MTRRYPLVLAILCGHIAATMAQTTNAPEEPIASTQEAAGLPLAEILSRSLSNSLDVALALERTREMRGDILSSRADLLPKLNASVSETRQVRSTSAYGLPEEADLLVQQDIPFDISYPGAPDQIVRRLNLPTRGVTTVDEQIDLDIEFADRTDHFSLFTTKLGLTVPLVDLQNLNEYRASREGKTQVSADLAAAQESVMFEAAQLYFTILLNQVGIRAYEEKVKLHEQRVALTEDLVRVGTSTALDLRKEKVALSTARRDLKQTQRTLALALRQLRTLIGAREGQPLGVSGKLRFQGIQTMPPDEAVTLAFDQRPDYQAQRSKEKRADLRRTAAMSDFYPTLSAIGNYGAQGNMPDDTVEIWFIGAVAQLPIWDSYKRLGKYEKFASEHRQMINRTADLKDAIETEIHSVIEELAYNAEAYAVADEAVQLGEEGLRLTKDRQAAGTATPLDVLGAEVDLAEAKYQRLEAVYTYDISCVKWFKAIGDVSRITTIAAHDE